MKRLIVTLLALTITGFVGEVSAGPAEEVAQIATPRLQAFQDGNLDALVAAFADNAVFQSALSPFRVEGKEAIRAHYAEVFQVYPRRRVLPRQSATRVYNDDLVITNSYSVLYLTNQQGQVMNYAVRSSLVWAKIGGKWQIVDQHGSRLPVAP